MTADELKVMATFPIVALDRPLKVVGVLNDKEYTLPAKTKMRVTGWTNQYLKTEQICTEADGERYVASQADLQDAKAVV